MGVEKGQKYSLAILNLYSKSEISIHGYTSLAIIALPNLHIGMLISF